MSVSVWVVLPIATLLIAGCADAVQIYVELMPEWMGSPEHPQGPQQCGAPGAAMRRQQA